MLQLAAARLGRVSVVMIARVRSSKARGENSSDLAKPGAAFRMRSTGNGTPITPVEQTTTCFTRQPSIFATSCAVASEAAMPPGPTEQFAFPEFTMTARIASGDARTWARERITGGACTRFCVNTAAADAGGSETISATSSDPVWPRFLRPAEAAENRKPRGSAREDGRSLIFFQSPCRISITAVARVFRTEVFLNLRKDLVPVRPGRATTQRAGSPRCSARAAHRVRGKRLQRLRPACSDVPWGK